MKDRSSKYILELSTRLYRLPFVRKCCSYFFSTKTPEKWVFILGCYNSGTTLLQNTLALHTEISTLPREGVRFTSELPQPEDLGWTRMWVKCKSYMQIEDEKTPDKAKQVMADWSPWWKKAATVYLEKSISNLTRISWLCNNFDNCYFIGITRNGYCSIEGMRRKARPKGEAISSLGSTEYPIELCAEQWVEANRLLHSRTNNLRIVQLKYEEFVADPVSVLTNLYNFLDIATPELSFIDGVLFINGTDVPISNMNSRSISSLTTNDVAKINRVIRETQLKLGYEVIEND